MQVLFSANLFPQFPLSALPGLAVSVTAQTVLTIVILGILVATLLLGVVFRGTFFFNRRRQELQSMAERIGLHPWPDNSIPRGLSLHGTPFFRPSKLKNVYEGLVNHIEVIVMDFHKIEPDESSWARTVIAVKASYQIATPPTLEYRKAGSWQLLYSPVGNMDSRKLMDSERVEIIVKSIIR